MKDFYRSETSLTGVIQGGILSSFLIGVYLNDFDWSVGGVVTIVKPVEGVGSYGLEWNNCFGVGGGLVVQYVRYVSDFIVGLSGEASMCQKWFQGVSKLVKGLSGVILSRDKLIYCSACRPVMFLGVLIRFRYQGDEGMPCNFFSGDKFKGVEGKMVIFSSSVNYGVVFCAPILDVKNKLAYCGFCYGGSK